MTNTYRALSPQAAAAFEPGVFEADFSVVDEKDHLDNGLLELVPRTYRVLSNNFSGGPQNSTYEAAFRREIEQALIQGGHIERVDTPAESELADGGDATSKNATAEGGKSAKK